MHYVMHARVGHGTENVRVHVAKYAYVCDRERARVAHILSRMLRVYITGPCITCVCESSSARMKFTYMVL